MKVLISGIVIFAVYALFTIRFYVCELMELCTTTDGQEQAVGNFPESFLDFEEIASYPIMEIDFVWGNYIPITNPGFANLKDSLLQIIASDTKALKIIGGYYEEEVNNSNYENLGLARAYALKVLLDGKKYDHKMIIESQKLSPGKAQNKNAFKGVEIEILEGAMENNAVRKIERLILNFPSASAHPMMTSEITSQLNEIIGLLNNEGVRVDIIGHTDDSGSEVLNMAMGMKRAEAVSKILIQEGVDMAKLNVISRGETEPIADNNTVEGKLFNRRVELHIKQ